jgi:hypothetical protein
MKRSIVSLTNAGVLVIAAYIAAQILSDIMSLKIALVLTFSIDAGTFIYPFTFTLRDLVHKLLGRVAARTVIVSAAVINLAMAGLFAFSAWRVDPCVAHRRRLHRRRGLRRAYRYRSLSPVGHADHTPLPVGARIDQQRRQRPARQPDLLLGRVRPVVGILPQRTARRDSVVHLLGECAGEGRGDAGQPAGHLSRA